LTSFATRRHVEAPDEIALADAERSLRWTEVADALNRGAQAVLALDLGEARRVAEFAENAVESVLAHVARC
jgi:hypothetical protein